MFTGEYFQPIVEEVFVETLLQLGTSRCQSRILKSLENFAREVSTDSVGTYTLGTRGLAEVLRADPETYSMTVCYETADWFVELFEYPGEAHAHGCTGRPCRYLHIHIGSLPPRGGSDQKIAIDIEDTLPPSSLLREDSTLWRYMDMDEMRDVFTRARDEIFIPHSIPILLDKVAHTNLLEKLAKTREAEWQEEIVSHNASVYHANAERAYKAKNYFKYLAEIGEIPTERLTKVDLARIKYVSKRFRD